MKNHSYWITLNRVWRTTLLVLFCAPVLLGCVKKKSMSDTSGTGTIGSTLTGNGTTTTTGNGTDTTGLGGTTTTTTGSSTVTGDGSVLPTLQTVTATAGSANSIFPISNSVSFGFPSTSLNSTNLGIPSFDIPVLPPDIRLVNETSNTWSLVGGQLRISNPASTTPAMANLNYSLHDLYQAMRIVQVGRAIYLYAKHHVRKHVATAAGYVNTYGNHCYTRCGVDAAGNLTLVEDIGGSIVNGGPTQTVPISPSSIPGGKLEFVNYQDMVACVFTDNTGKRNFVGSRQHMQPEEPVYLFGFYGEGDAIADQAAVSDLKYVAKKVPITTYRNSFDGSSGTPGPELVQTGSGTPVIYSDALATTTPGTPAMLVLRNSTLLREYEVSSDVRVRDNGTMASVVLRYSNGYYYSVELHNDNASSQYLSIMYHTPSAASELARMRLNDPDEDIFKFDMSGTFNITARISGNQIQAFLNGQYIMVANPTALSSGAPGLRFDAPSGSSITAVGMDNFRLDAVGR